jgi:hypothetical protein
MVVSTYVATGEVTTLEHELGDDAVEAGALVVEGLAGLAGALLAGAESAEVLGSLFGLVSDCFLYLGSRGKDSDDKDSASGVLTLGTTSLKSSMMILPAGWPPMVQSKNTLGLLGFSGRGIVMDVGLMCCEKVVVVEESVDGKDEGQL